MSKPFGKGSTGLTSVEVGEEAKSGESRIRRNTVTSDALLIRPVEGINTVYDVLVYAARESGSKDTMGTREILKVHEEYKDVEKTVGGKVVVEKKKWQYYELSGFKYITYAEMKKRADAIGRGLTDLGLKKGDNLNVYSSTSMNWQLVSFACASISVTIATAYDTLGEPGLIYALNEPECLGVFTNADLFPLLSTVLPQTPTIRLIIYDGTPKPEQLENLKAVRQGLTILSLDEVRARGEAIPISPEETKARLPKSSDVHCIMYTSGGMGVPKGVEITHGNLVASTAGLSKLYKRHNKPDDTYMAYLPLAHVWEFAVELLMIYFGATLGYGKIKTLTDASVRNCKGDIKEFRPTIMLGVPAIWETIRKGILTQVNAGGMIKKTVFHGSVGIKKAGVPGLTQIVDSLVFNQIKAAIGGRLRIAVSGGASLSPDTHEFLTFIVPHFIQGYGMTETCGICTINIPEMVTDTVGVPVPCAEIKLLDVPDVGYLTTNKPQQGELCVRGAAVVKGYFKRPDLNSDPTIFTPDGWFRTGDIGQWNPDGTMSIVDRIKNLIKLQGGEYIALERLEATYKSCNFVQGICVYGHPQARQPMAIITVHEAQLRQFLNNQPIDGVDAKAPLDQLCQNDAVRKLILNTCNAIGRRAGFKQMELLEAIVLSPTEWTSENGHATAAQKIFRKVILETFKSEIKEVYPY